MNDSGKTAVSFLLGIIAGGALGIMFAPKTGKETREDLQKYIKNAEDKLAKLRGRRDAMEEETPDSEEQA
jgi:gas vesicle protein